jgi:hypothetical protein
MNFECLRILAECEQGATEDALLARGITKEILVVLHEDGWVDAMVRRFANPAGLVINHYYITDVGRKALEQR